LRENFGAKMSHTSKSRSTVGRRAGKPAEPTLPAFSDWSPSWRAREDRILGEALCQISKPTLSAKSLGRNGPERTEALDEILDYFALQGVTCRTANDVERRVVALESAFGDEPSGFNAFRALAASVAATEPPLRMEQKKASPMRSATAPAKPPGRGAAGKSGDKRAAEAPVETAGSGRATAAAKPNQPQAKKAKLAGRRSGGHSPGSEEESDSETDEEEGGAADFVASVSAGAGGGSAAVLFSPCRLGCPLPSLHSGMCQAAAGSGPRQRQATQRLGVGDGFLNTPASAWGSTLAAATKAGSQTHNSSNGASARPAGSPAIAAAKFSPPPASKARSSTAAATPVARLAPKGAAAAASKGKLKAGGSSKGSSSSGALGAASAAGRRGGGRSAAVAEIAAGAPEEEEAEESRVPSAMEVEEDEMEREMEAAALSATALAAPAVAQTAAASASTSTAAPVARSAPASAAGKELPAALSLRDNEGFPVAAPVLSALVRQARRNVYTRLLSRTGALAEEDETGGEEIHGHLHSAVRSELRDQLLRTAGGLENATLLLVGPKGAGKSRLLGAVLAGLRAAVDEPVDYLTVDLTTLLMSDESSTLMAIAAQLGLTAQVHV